MVLFVDLFYSINKMLVNKHFDAHIFYQKFLINIVYRLNKTKREWKWTIKSMR